jgi:hypothetical protein
LRIALSAAAEALKRADDLESLSTGRLNRTHAMTAMGDQFPHHLRDARQAAQLLRMRAQILAQDGQPDAALADVRRMLAIARFSGVEPSLITKVFQMAIRSLAVSTAEHVLGQGTPSAAALAATQQAVTGELADPLILDALRGERAWVEDTMRALDDGRITFDDLHAMDDIPKVTGYKQIDAWIYRLRGGGSWAKRPTAEVLRYQTCLIEIAKVSPEALRTRADEIAAHRSAMSPKAQEVTQSYDQYITAERRSRALLASATVALAAERFRRANGQWPHAIADLVAAKLLPAVPTDPFDGQPLRMRRLADGLVVYSVGQNLIDDGGELRGVPNVNMGVPKDIGFRLWDVPHRGQAPKGEMP